MIIDEIMVGQKQYSSTYRNTVRNTCLFLHVLFLNDHNFINNHPPEVPPDLKLVSNDARSAICYTLR
jgi:hypothetical protein